MDSGQWAGTAFLSLLVVWGMLATVLRHRRAMREMELDRTLGKPGSKNRHRLDEAFDEVYGDKGTDA